MEKLVQDFIRIRKKLLSDAPIHILKLEMQNFPFEKEKAIIQFLNEKLPTDCPQPLLHEALGIPSADSMLQYIQCLLEAGADPNIQGLGLMDEMTCLTRVVSTRDDQDLPCIEALVNHGARVTMPYSQEQCYNPFLNAVSYGMVKVTAFFLKLPEVTAYLHSSKFLPDLHATMERDSVDLTRAFCSFQQTFGQLWEALQVEDVALNHIREKSFISLADCLVLGLQPFFADFTPVFPPRALTLLCDILVEGSALWHVEAALEVLNHVTENLRPDCSVSTESCSPEEHVGHEPSVAILVEWTCEACYLHLWRSFLRFFRVLRRSGFGGTGMRSGNTALAKLHTYFYEHQDSPHLQEHFHAVTDLIEDHRTVPSLRRTCCKQIRTHLSRVRNQRPIAAALRSLHVPVAIQEMLLWQLDT